MAEPEVLSHWHQSIDRLSINPPYFYADLQQAIEKLQIPGVAISITNIAEGAVISSRRQYLRVKRGDYHFDICGAPFANGSFVSYWVTRDEGCLRGCVGIFPGVEWVLSNLVFRETFYRVDTRLMFQGAVHGAVMEVLDGMLIAKGLRTLSDEQRRESVTKLLK